MEPVTHILTGACLARSGFNRRVAYATAAMAIAAEFPDIDTLWGLRGPVAGFQHHRGITHTFLGIPFEAAFVVALFWLAHKWRERRNAANPNTAPTPTRPLTAAPVLWTALYACVLLALLSHLLLDYTNNYGLRPFFPFNPRWYAASIVFIFDPLIFLVLVAGLLLPSLFGLIGREVGARREPFRNPAWPRLALLAILALWSIRAFEHKQALALANLQTLRAPGASLDPGASESLTPGDQGPAPPSLRPLLQPRASLASPDPLSLFRWYTATDFGPAYTLGTADTHVGTLTSTAILVKAQPGPLLAAARASHLGRVYLDWSPMPLVTLEGENATARNAPNTSLKTAFLTTFQDVRFMGNSPLLHREGTTPLTGTVILDANGRVLAQGMDGRFGR